MPRIHRHLTHPFSSAITKQIWLFRPWGYYWEIPTTLSCCKHELMHVAQINVRLKQQQRCRLSHKLCKQACMTMSNYGYSVTLWSSWLPRKDLKLLCIRKIKYEPQCLRLSNMDIYSVGGCSSGGNHRVGSSIPSCSSLHDNIIRQDTNPGLLSDISIGVWTLDRKHLTIEKVLLWIGQWDKMYKALWVLRIK